MNQSRLRIGIAIANTENTATLELNGDEGWFEECLPHLGALVKDLTEKYGRDDLNEALVNEEFIKAKEALVANQNFIGQIVTVTRTTESENTNAPPSADGAP